MLIVYVSVALLNYTLVQSMAGSWASDYFSREWGGKVRIGSMGCNPFNHLVLRNVELINPDNDTICTAGCIALRFKKFPFDSHGLTFSRVKLKDTYYHLAIDTGGLNLGFIIDYYSSKETDDSDTSSAPEFKVLVDDLVMDNVCYRQDLKDLRSEEERRGVPGVDVKHMEYREIDAHFRNVRVDKDFVTCRIDRMTTKEKSGLEVKEMHMNVYATRCGISATNMHVETADSRLIGDVLLDFPHWKTMSHFLDSVIFTCHFDKGSYGNMRDASYWAHTLWGMDERIYIEGDFGGPIADFYADNVHLSFGKESVVNFDGNIRGLPHIDSTVIDADIHRLYTTYEDLAAVRHPNGIKMKAEKLVRQLEFVDMEATFSGTIYDFFATLDVKSQPGNLTGDVIMRMNPKLREYHYVGELKSDGFYIGRIAPNEWVSRTGFELTFEGDGFDPKTMNATLEGRLGRTVLKGHRIMSETAIDVDAADGKIVAEASLDDAIGRIGAHGEVEWRDDRPIYRADIDAENVDIKTLGLWTDTVDEEARLDAHVSGRYASRTEGNAHARLEAEGVKLRTTTRHCELKNATLTAREQNHWKNITLRSDVANAQMTGYFRYEGLGEIVKRMGEYIPSVQDKTEIAENYERIADARFELNVEVTDTAGLLRVFVPKLTLAEGTTVQANYNFEESLKTIVRSDSVGWGNVMVYNVGLNGESLGEKYRLRATSDELRIGELLLSENTDFSVESSHKGANCRAYWENSSKTVGGGDVNLRVVAEDDRVSLLVDPSHLALGGEEWHLSSRGDNYASKKGLNVDGLGLENGNQHMWLTARRMGENNDSIDVRFSDFSIGVANTFLGESGMTIDGRANGDMRIGFLWQKDKSTPYLNSDLTVEGLMFDGEPLGDARIQSTWNADMNQLNLYLTSTDENRIPIQASGFMTLGGKSPELDFAVSAESIGLRALQPMVSVFSSQVEGHVSAEVDIKGTLKEPDITGWLSMEESRIKIDMLGVMYMINDTIGLETDKIDFDAVPIVDEMGNVALLNGVVRHNHLKDMVVDLKLHSDRLLCMNTGRANAGTQAYFGRVLSEVDGTVDGSMDNIEIEINARTLDGTVLTIPIDDKREVQSADYIHFVSESYYDDSDIPVSVDPVRGPLNMPSTGNEPEQPESNGNWRATGTTESNSKFHLTINVETTPDMQMHIPMDFSSVEADVKVRGSGDLQLMVGTEQSFSIIGDYEINTGTVALDLLGVLSKEFAVDEGSSITFPGTVNDALFDINAVYSQRVNMSTLTGTHSSTESQKPITVENVIALRGTLQSPEIDFDLRLPGADQSVQEEVFAYIDRNNERDMLNQTVSLLLSKRFYNMSTTMTEQPSSNAASEAYGLVANTLGSVVSDMVDFVDVGFAYQAGNEMWNEQYALDISKEWNKFYFESTFGFGGESKEMAEAGGNNNMTGDMLVGYKINPRLHLFVFNRSNTNDYTRSDLPYKQGVGVKYTRDFDTLKELFRRKKKNTKIQE